ncbi:MAG TPA: AAA family ATPase, partial [Bacteroidales bacterium]|nr:AAA family ATPase [Bacteroidales bacterium]
IEKNIDKERIHPEITNVLEKIDQLSLCRQWEQDLTSYLTTGAELADVFKAEQEENENRLQNVHNELSKIENSIKKAHRAVEKAEEEREEVYSRLCEEEASEADLKRKNRTLFKKAKNDRQATEIEAISNNIKVLKKELKEKKDILQAKELDLENLGEKADLRKRILNSINEFTKREKELAEARKKYLAGKNMVHSMNHDSTASIQEKKEIDIELAKEAVEKIKTKVDLLLIAAEKYFDGKSYHQSYIEAEKELNEKEYYWGPEELAEKLFQFIPEFEMFEDFSSLLPNRIDLTDIIDSNKSAEGYKAAINFLTITGLDYSFFSQPSSRILKQKIENLNGELTLNFQDFWRQNVGKNNKIKINFELAHYDASNRDKIGQPFLEFWIKDESERLYPKQRSRGVRWFLSFFMELKANAMDQARQDKILLIDEPGVSLHARAQEDVLKVFDDIKAKMQIIYSTHSPHLIDVNKLYRIIAVQRALEDDMNSETILLNTKSLKTATADTLSPVYSMMGTRLNQQEIVKSFNNVVVKDLTTYYYLKSILILTGYNKKECFFIPSSGPSGMPMIINILIGWGLDYLVLNFGNDEEKYVYNKLRKELFDNNVNSASGQLIFLREYMEPEDFFSTIDFKKYIVKVREGITESNSEYLKDNNHSRTILASDFLQDVTQGKISLKTLDEETRENFKMVIKKLDNLLI